MFGLKLKPHPLTLTLKEKRSLPSARATSSSFSSPGAWTSGRVRSGIPPPRSTASHVSYSSALAVGHVLVFVLCKAILRIVASGVVTSGIENFAQLFGTELHSVGFP